MGSKRFSRVVILLTIALVLGVMGGSVFAQTAPFTVGISNGFVGSEWRTQMVENARQAFEEYKAQGLTDRFVPQSADVDVTGQIGQIRNMIAAGVDLIIVNPNSQTAMNLVFEEAAMRGIQIIAIDQEVTSPHAVNVVIDQSEWARISARWLVEQLGGSGNIVVINGIAGHPANEDRWAGAKEVFDAAPFINVLTVANADWDQATGQQVMSNLLATYPNIDGVWVQDGMAEGALRALLAAGGDLPVVTGEARVGYMRLWEQLRNERGFSTIGVANPPGGSISGMHIGLGLLQGKELKDEVLSGNTVYIPIPVVVTNDNFDEIWATHKDFEDAYSVDGYLSAEEAQAYFKN